MRIGSRAQTLSRWLEEAIHTGAFLLLLLKTTVDARAEDFTYTTNNGRITITGYSGPGGNVTIPSTVTGLPVTSIGAYSFQFLTNLASVNIPDSVVEIENAGVGDFGAYIAGGTFWGCSNLTKVVVGKGLSFLGLGAFYDCTNLLGVYFKGNAPALGYTLFGVMDIFGYWSHDGQTDPSTVYYLPGTTGWGSTLAGRLALLWNPQIQTGDAGFGARPSGFGFNITSTSNIPIVIEASANLGVGSWVPLQSCTLTNGLVYFGDPQWTNFPSRFYRIRSP